MHQSQVISGSNERTLQEKRRALTSLRTYQPGKVSSVRVASSSGAGTVPVATPATTTAPPRSNAPVTVYEDSFGGAAGASFSGMAAAAAPTSILSAVKRQEAPKENTLKPGTWSAAKLKKVHVGGVHRAPSFTSRFYYLFQFFYLFEFVEKCKILVKIIWKSSI